MSKSLSEIINFFSLDINYESSILGVYFSDLTLDSRGCTANDVFVAFKGQTLDGNNFIEDVLSKGCKLIISDSICKITDDFIILNISNIKDNISDFSKWFYRYKKPSNIIGITGTNGKTSISSYIAQLSNISKKKTLLLGTNGNGIYPNLKTSSHTTLDNISLYRNISKYNDIDNLVMEVSSHSLDQKRVAGIDFDTAVFSNLTHDHLDYHDNMDNYFLAKSKLFTDYKSLSKAVINIDDVYGEKLSKMIDVENILTVSIQDVKADLFLKILSKDFNFTEFEIFINQKSIGIYKTSLIGDFNISNLALSLASFKNIEEVLTSIVYISEVKGRMEKVLISNSDKKVIIDYAHTPDALDNILSTLDEYSSNIICLFGCGGDRDKSKRKTMAKVAEKYSKKIIITEDNNRYEDIDSIFDDIRDGFSKEHIFIKDRRDAIFYALNDMQDNDILILAGKGHEKYIDNQGVKKFFDERDVIREYGDMLND